MMSPKKDKKLRCGFTTGTAAAAATKGALMLLLDGRVPDHVTIRLLTGKSIRIPVYSCLKIDDRSAQCSIIKDAGDDPDITHKAEIGATVCLSDHAVAEPLIITGGKGVGKVTKPGLGIPLGEPAITRGPRKMISEAVGEVLKKHRFRGSVLTRVFVPEGENLAKKTLNARLGILGGISILGTTGVVRPISHEAYIATIDAALSVAKASGIDQVVLTTGRRGERFSQKWWKQLPVESFIQIGDFFKMSLTKVAEKRFRKASITVFFGKAVKMAQGIPHTHAARSSLTLERLSKWAWELTGNKLLSNQIATANTARHALDFILPEFPEVVSRVGEEMVGWARTFAGPSVQIQGVIYGFDGHIIFDSETTLS